ncbi:MAG: hypothetical protein V4725_06705 [Bacteroidota bacterium]
MKNQIAIMMLVLTSLLTVNHATAQNIAINGTGNLPDTSAMLDVSSTNKGFLVPRMTTTQQNAIPLPANGLLVFNTTDNVFKVNTGSAGSPVWTGLVTGSGATTNLLSSSVNTLTNTTNGVAATADIINSVSNQSSANTLSSTINGVAGTGVNIINSNAIALSGANLTSTVNGIATSALNLTPAITSVAWAKTGNAGITQPAAPATYGTSTLGAAEHFVGTTDAKDLVLATNNLERLRILNSNGNIGIGTAAPLSSFEINGGMATKIVKSTSGSGITFDNSATVWYLVHNLSVTLPAASTCANRRYLVVNRHNSSKTLSACTSLSGTATTAIAGNASVEIISDGTTWLQIR